MATSICPACHRPFERVDDFPRIRVMSFERLPTPEAVDDMSDAAAEKALEWHRRNPKEKDWSRRGINMTPETEQACRRADVTAYLYHLASLVGPEVDPRELLPPWPAHRYFKRAYPIPETRLLIGLHEGDPTPGGDRTTDIDIMCKGVNLGSAGGPTLSVLGPIARLTYRGLLAQSTSAAEGHARQFSEAVCKSAGRSMKGV